MSILDLLQGMAERVSAGASVRSVYGDPVTAGARTVIPVAEVRYGFGCGGGGKGKGGPESGGGGGRAIARPCGALEVAPEGTRFIEFGNRRKLGAAVAAGFAVDTLLAMMTRPKRVDIVRRA
jgi:uncharacterized spore protein YtfJ